MRRMRTQFVNANFVGELVNAYFVAKIGVDAAQNGPSEVWNRKPGVLVTKFNEWSSSR